MKNDKDDEVSSAPLTPEELKALRRIIRDDDRARWFWSVARVWGAYSAAAVTFAIAAGKPVVDFFKWLFK